MRRLHEPDAEERDDVGWRRLADAPRLGRDRPLVDRRPDELDPELAQVRLGLVRQRRGGDLVLRRESEHRDEAGHRAAVTGEDPVAVAGQTEAEPVAREPALVVGDRLHRAHLLGARRGEHGLVRIGKERAPAADVAGRPPQLACGRPRAGLNPDRVPDPVGVRLGEIALGRRRLRLEAHARQPDGLEQPLADVVLIRHARDALDDDAEEREREVGVVEPRAGRQHELRLGERLEQLVRLREPQAQPGVVVRLALQARGVREQPADRRRVRGSLDVPVERVLEVELPRVSQLHDRGRGERLRDRPDAVLRVGRRLETGFDVRGADRLLPDQLAVAEHRRADARHALLALLAEDEALETRRQALGSLRHGRRAPPAFARSPAPPLRRRCRGA